MPTLETLKLALQQKANEASSSSAKRELSDTEYSTGFDILIQGPGCATYQDFIVPQLTDLLTALLTSRSTISVLEIGPGPRSVLGYLPCGIRQKIKKYTAFEGNGLFAKRLKEWIGAGDEEAPFPGLQDRPDIRNGLFDIEKGVDVEKYDVVLFCHRMDDMKPNRSFIEKALRMLVQQPRGGMVVVFQLDGVLHFDGLVCHQTAAYPNGVVSVKDEAEALDHFSRFIAGFIMEDTDVDEAVRKDWRSTCRALGHHDKAYPGHLSFDAPGIMIAFTQDATSLPELTALVPLVKEDRKVKNREASFHSPAAIVRPTEIRHIQECVRWALKHKVSLTIIGGGHSGHCLWPNVVAVDMSAFDKIHIIKRGDGSDPDFGPLVVVEAGCKTGDIIRQTMNAGLTVPMGARPSVGAGLWLQGGIGHLARLHGLTCDAIVGAVVVSVHSGQILHVGCVPDQHRPIGSIRPDNEAELLWGLKGAGTNFGIVVSVTFKAYPAAFYIARHAIAPLANDVEMRRELSQFANTVATRLRRDGSGDAYLFWDNRQLHIGMSIFGSFSSDTPIPRLPSDATTIGESDWGQVADSMKPLDGIGVFDAEMYVSAMHGGHGGGKTSSFKRCLFFKDIGEPSVTKCLFAAMESRPSPLSYLHLIQGGGAVREVASDATAFGCRDWDFACVITGVWCRDQDGTEVARSAVRWVYDVASNLMSLSNCSGAYGADLGPDPRDHVLAAKAFGRNGPRLAHLKQCMDPSNILAYACPLLKISKKPKLIILVTGDSGVGKDYCAEVWASVFRKFLDQDDSATAVISISDETKREYAAATGADFSRLISDRVYKENHRPALTRFFQEQVRQRPRLPEEHFLNVVYAAADADVLLITGLRDEAPVAEFSHLVPHSRLLDVRVQASEKTRQIRTRCHRTDGDGGGDNDSRQKSTNLEYRPSLIFDNDRTGKEASEKFAESYLLPFLNNDLQRLADMVRTIPNFPREGIEFRHVLGISQTPGGLALCTSLFRNHFRGDWSKVGAIASCEAGGFIFASALASQMDLPLVLIREAGKLPPPTLSVVKPTSHISALGSPDSKEKRIELERGVVPKDASVVVVDDVLATGRTLCAVLQLLFEAGVEAEGISVMVVAEFPAHRGRHLLRQAGFGKIDIQSLLVFGGF